MVLEGLKRFFKKGPFRYELQAYGAKGGRGWVTIADMDTPAKVEECTEYFEPGVYYQLMARDLEKGTYAKRVWKHFEPRPGIQPHELPERAPPAAPRERRRPHEVMGEYAAEVTEVLTPAVELIKGFKELIDSFKEEVSPAMSSPEGGGGRYRYEIPAPKFKGEGLPDWTHPYIIHEIGNVIKDVTDHVATRFGIPPPTAPPATPPVEAEEVVPELPSPEAYMPAPAAPPVEEAPTEAPIEEVEETVPAEAEVEQAEVAEKEVAKEVVEEAPAEEEEGAE